MRYLLDTHIWLWMLSSPEKIGLQARQVIDDPSSDLLLSAASSWEIAIKHAIGRLSLPGNPEEFVPDRMGLTGVVGLAVGHAHALRAGALPPHHRDPFDRLLVSQAQLERMPLITADPVFERYEVELLAGR